MSRVRYLPSAEGDLLEIARYIGSGNPDRAISFVGEIRKACDVRADFPLSGRVAAEYGDDLRCFPHKNYLIVYLPEEDGICIVRIFEGSRDIGSEF